MKNRQWFQIRYSLILAAFLWTLPFASFADEDPIGMLKGVSSKVMSELRNHKEVLKNNPSRLYGMVNQLIIPHADFNEMARWVVGRNAWNAASASNQQALVSELKTMVINTYARSLLNYSDETIEFLPIRGGYAGKERIQVSSIVRGKNNLRLDYRLIQESGNWKVYDILVEGVSLIQGYRAQFAETAQRGGVEAVLDKMRKHNSKGAKE
jgi:phospholipid transport system substrate-binding protein